MSRIFEKELPPEPLEEAPDGFVCTSRAVNYSIESLVNKLNNGKLVLPEFQREFCWGRNNVQTFARSVINGVPIFNVAFVTDPEDPQRKPHILDGLQRLSSMSSFLNNKTHLGKGKRFSKFKFKDLPEEKQQEFLNKEITVIHIETSQKYWAYLFRTYNKGGAPLNAIEIRRSVYEKLTLLFDLQKIYKENNEFIAIFGKNTRFKGLHVLLRSLAMHFMYNDYQKPLEQFLDHFCNFLVEENIDMTEKIDQLSYIIKALYQNPNLGKKSFRQASGKPVNLGLIDCMFHGGLLLLKKNPKLTVKELGLELEKLYVNIVSKDNGAMLIALGMDTSGKDSVLSRMSLVEELLDINKG